MAGRSKLELAHRVSADRRGHTVYADCHFADESQIARSCAQSHFRFCFATAAALGTLALGQGGPESGGIWVLRRGDDIGPALRYTSLGFRGLSAWGKGVGATAGLLAAPFAGLADHIGQARDPQITGRSGKGGLPQA